MVRLLAIAVWIATLAAAWPAQAQDNFRCRNGANVDREERCRFFAHFDERGSDDPRILQPLGVQSPDGARSIAIVVGIDEYPNWEGGRIQAAADDVRNLRRFLINHQDFDEVIVLQNDDATAENIRYFLQIYVPARGTLFQNRTRVLFAYSGHGLPGNDEAEAALVLNRATWQGDGNHLLPLSELRGQLQRAARASYQVIALINACYGGDIFRDAPSGGNPYVITARSAHAMTAGARGSLVWTAGEAGRGSVFFDSLIGAVAAANRQTIYDPASGRIVQRGNAAVPLIDVFGDVTRQIAQRPPPLNETQVSPPWWGSIREGEPSEGGFFLLTTVERPWDLAQIFTDPLQVLSNPFEYITRPVRATATAPIYAPSGPVSSVPGRPDLQVFNPPQQYPIQGIDISEEDFGTINWQRVRQAGIRFVYFRATSGASRVDARLQQNLSETQDAGLLFGAYHVFSFCEPVEAQLRNVTGIFPVSDRSMPMVVDFGAFRSTTAERRCRPRIDEARAHALEFLQGVEAHYGKRPVIYGPTRVISDLLDPRFAAYALWVADFFEGGEPVRGAPRAWTLWQYGDGIVDGISEPVAHNAFFGTEEQFAVFMAGDSEVARRQ
jgi:GH25 family lysozyme M1 (1,4-beta-N-acetylmuramidase)